jgi:preprotein translocase subunit SecF
MEANQETHKESSHNNENKGWYDKWYKPLLVIPIIVMILCLVYIGFFYSQHGTIMLRDSSLTGGTTITITGDINTVTLESQLKSQFPDLITRKLTDIATGKPISVIIESSAAPDKLKPALEKFLGYSLTDKNSSIEFTGSSLSQSFYQQLIIALIISFILMSFVVFILFRTFVPSMAIIFAAFGDIVIPLAIIDFVGIRISAAGIAAFLMLIGYSVDTDVLLTTRALKRKGGTLNSRIYGAFKTGTLMTTTAIVAVLPSFFIVTALPESFRQIFFILALGLFADIFNTWLTNASIIKWYCVGRKIE